MSDSPPSSDFAMQRRPTRSVPSVWKNCLSLCQSEQSVGRDRCDILGVCPIDADLVWSSWVFAQILDVTKDMAATILTDEVAEVCTKTHICHL